MIEIYDKEEEKIINELSNLEIQAFNNLTFNISGYPHRIKHKNRLIHYLDTMHENKKYFDDTFKIKEEDKELVDKVLTFVENFSQNNFKKKITPIYSVLSAYEMFKNIQPFIEEVRKNKKVKIFEIGPGSGILGIMLNLKYEDVCYASTDNSQAFYILQSSLYKDLDNNFSEHLIEKKKSFFDDKSKLANVPWWVFLKNENLKNEQFDIIICDHALAEMNRYCLSFYLKRSSKFLENSYNSNSIIPYFIYRSLGRLTLDQQHIYKELDRLDFFLFFSSEKINVFSTKVVNLKYFNFLKSFKISNFFGNKKIYKIYRICFTILMNVMIFLNYRNLFKNSKIKIKDKQSIWEYISKRKIYYSDDHHFLNKE